MLIGVSEDQFWNSTVRQLKPYATLYEKRQFEKDRDAYRQGAYIYEALVSVMSSLGGKRSKIHHYPDKPFMATQEEEKRIEAMTEEEKTDKVEEIFAMLASGHE